ncbi:MptD family putative ECF transporter S component [Serratia fonticola]|uniref:MptD family putative ECF transporter S component n=1 Tax=Serratia fonticola TaxID=47917 RepID=UPI0015C5C21C|nr:MptD family putative ECF transporter S component [Serratia fonticola]NXZ85506.1 MptD family putative ECF transporter S component [Serratia fonticola]
MSIRPAELITLGIFSVMIITINMAINMLAVLSPFLIPITKSLSGMMAGIPFMLYLARVKQKGLISLMAMVLATVMVLAGDYVLTLVSALIAGGIADIICSAARKNQRRALMVLGYGIFNLWSVGGLLPLLFMRQKMESQVAEQLGQEYAHSFSSFFSAPVIGWLLAGIFVSGLLGAVIGLGVLNKHFVRSGLVQKQGG